MQEIQFDYFHGMEAEQYTFYRIPKILFTAECFKTISCEAKVLYGLLLDRMSLSIKNRWFDEEDRVYIIFTVEEIAELMNCGTQKAVRLLKELDSEKGIGLVEKRRLGLGKPNVIYVKNFMVKQPEKEEKEPEKPVQSDKEPPAEQPTEEVKPKTAYDYEFDIEAIRNDLISLGCSMGLTHITTDDGTAITPDNASWATPVTASESFQGERLKRKLTDYVQSMPDIITAYGGAPIEYFTIYIEPLGSGSYRIYFLY